MSEQVNMAKMNDFAEWRNAMPEGID